MGVVAARRIFSDETQRLALRARDVLAGFGVPRRTEARQVPPPEIREAYRILNFALRAGAAMLACGASTNEVESIILDLTAACGLDRCETDVTFTSMTASYIRGDDCEPVTAVWVVRRRTVNYEHLARINALRDDLKAGRILPEAAITRLDEVLAEPPRDPRKVLIAWAGMAAAFTVLLGGGWIAGLTAFVSAALVTLLIRAVARYGIPDFFQSALGAAVATGVAMAVMTMHIPVQPPLVVAGGIMVLVPGYALVASVRDAITGFPISGSARGLEVLFTAVGILTGVAFVLYLGVSFGVRLSVGSVVTTAPIEQVVVQVIAAGVAACLYAVAAQVPRGSLAHAGLVGAGGWAVFLMLGKEGMSLVPATAVAAVLIGAAGTVLARTMGTHAFLYMVPGVMPLVPGLTLYQGMLYLFHGSSQAVSTLLHAVTLGLTIAAGGTLGELIVRPLRPARPASTEPDPAVVADEDDSAW